MNSIIAKQLGVPTKRPVAEQPAPKAFEQGAADQVIKGSQRSDGTFRKDIQIREGFVNVFETKKYTIPQRRGDNAEKPMIRETGRPQIATVHRIDDQSKPSVGWRGSDLKQPQISKSSNSWRRTVDEKVPEKFQETDFPDLLDTPNEQSIKSDPREVNESKQAQNLKQEMQLHRNNVKGDVEKVQAKSEKGSQSQSMHSITGMYPLFKNSNDKEIKKLSKKLREIETLESKQKEGMELMPEALEKISKKDEILEQIKRLSQM